MITLASQRYTIAAYSGTLDSRYPTGSDFSHGQTYTIAGTGFGSRGDYGAISPNPADNGTLVWTFNDFEGSTIPGDTGWNFNSGEATHWEHVTTNLRHSRSTKHARRFDVGNIQYLRASATIPAESDLVFFSVWIKQPSAWLGKTLRWNTNSGDAGAAEHWMNCGDVNVTLNNTPDYYTEPTSYRGSGWFRHYGYLKGRTTETQDQKFYILGHNSNNDLGITPNTGLPTRLGIGEFNPMIGAGSNVVEGSVDGWHYDDLYYDFSQARVELADSATWASVTYSELQIPLAWSDTEIQFRVKAGAFASGATAHIHVFDSSGNRTYHGPVTVA